MRRLAKLIDSGLRVIDQEKLVRTSEYFDPEWYVRTYPEVGAVAGALCHYLSQGAAKGYDPGPKFSTSAYLAANPDVRDAGCNPLVHYIRFGRDEGRGIQHPGNGDPEPLGSEAMERVVEAFDAEFYAASNPDLPAETDLLAHFLGTGWRELRDPCDWFSTAYYLVAHPDLAETGQNPFVHYLLWGCREGRDIKRSTRPVHDRREAPDGRPLFSVLSMVRNEGDIIRAFAGHLLALFDEVVFIDHMSDDGTAEFLHALASGNQRVKVIRLEEPAYIQSVAMTHVLRNTDALREADWVFLLDADEFLPFADRAEMEAALDKYADCPVIGMRWQNLVPQTYWQSEVQFSPQTRFIVPPELSPFRKVAFQPRRLPLARTIVAQGNHALVETLNGIEVPSFCASFPLLHFPVRSVDQLALKLNQGVEAYRQLGRSRDAAHGTHWDQMMRATVKGDVTPDLLNAVVVRYSEDKPELEPLPAARLLTVGHRVSTFDLAHHDTGVGPVFRRGLAEMLMRIHGAPAPEKEIADCPAATRLEDAEGVLRRASGDTGAEYGQLEQPSRAEPTQTAVTGLLGRLMTPGYRDIEDLVPSPKAEHILFLFSLADIARPRRIVEIGTLRGASFLALCQAARQCGLSTEAVAISSWAVAPEDAATYRNAFETFSFLASKYSDFAGILRTHHEDAATRFAEGSIDLLHLDGFCEEAPLRRALGIWIPKLSSQGLLLVHDTNAHGGDYGVWRVWEELATRYPALEFPHSGGLGLACIGKDTSADLATLCALVEKDRSLRTMVRHHFERMGRMSAELFSRRYDMGQAEARARAEGAQTEEISWLRQENDSLKVDNQQLRELLKRSVSHAVNE
ncbi:MAG: glycosyltransferase family 2 protein [Silicimonas sp.]